MLFCFDFDGTLSDIVKNPDAQMKKKKWSGFAKMIVCVISGKGYDLKTFKVKNIIYCGNHGAETREGMVTDLDLMKHIRKALKARFYGER